MGAVNFQVLVGWLSFVTGHMDSSTYAQIRVGSIFIAILCKERA